MNQLEGNSSGVLNLNNACYEYTILVSKSVLSKTEIFTLTALSLCLIFSYYLNDISLCRNLKILGGVLHVFILFWLLNRILCGVKSESIFVVNSLGLQTTTVYHSTFKSYKFIPWNVINDVIINEAIVTQKVIFYLAVLVQTGQTKEGELIIPLFINAQPRLSELKKIYRNIQEILKS